MTSFGNRKGLCGPRVEQGALLIEEITCVCGILYVESPYSMKNVDGLTGLEPSTMHIATA